MGDGDCAAIGGNHLIHAARRNVDLPALIFNNQIYGMTGGQAGPTTHIGDHSTTSPFGNSSPPSTSASWRRPRERPTWPAPPPGPTSNCRT